MSFVTRTNVCYRILATIICTLTYTSDLCKYYCCTIIYTLQYMYHYTAMVDLVFNPVANFNVAMPKFSHTLKGNTIPFVQNQHHGHDDYVLVKPIQVEVMYNSVIEATQVNTNNITVISNYCYFILLRSCVCRVMGVTRKQTYEEHSFRTQSTT